jgi:hypothetical protein
MKPLRGLAALLLFVCCARVSYGDGGTILLHQDSGPFIVTLFAAEQPLRVGPADLSVMVQDKATGDILLDPVIEVTMPSQTVRLQSAHSGNRLLQAGTVNFSHPGRWPLQVEVRRGKDVARLSTELTVEADHSRSLLVWFYVLLPAVIIVLFLLNQTLKRRNAGGSRK